MMNNPPCTWSIKKDSSFIQTGNPTNRVWQKNAESNGVFSIKTSYPSSSYIELKKYNVIKKDNIRLTALKESSIPMIPVKIKRNNYNAYRVFIQDPYDFS